MEFPGVPVVKTSPSNASGTGSIPGQRTKILYAPTEWALNLIQVFWYFREKDLPTKVCIVKAMVFPVGMYRYESWTIEKAGHQRTDASNCGGDDLSPLDSKEIEPVNPKGDKPWKFIGRTDAEAPIFWPPDTESRPTGKDPDAGKDWGQEEKGAIVWWHHQLNGHKFELILGDSGGQRSPVCCSPWGHKESDMT